MSLSMLCWRQNSWKLYIEFCQSPRIFPSVNRLISQIEQILDNSRQKYYSFKNLFAVSRRKEISTFPFNSHGAFFKTCDIFSYHFLFAHKCLIETPYDIPQKYPQHTMPADRDILANTLSVFDPIDSIIYHSL